MSVRSLVHPLLLRSALVLAALGAGSATRSATDVYEGPARFARVRAIEGKVLIGHAYDGDFVDLQRNDPVGEGDRLNLEKGARILLAFTDGTQLAAIGPTRVELLHLAPRRPFELRLHEGEIAVETLAQRQLLVDSPEGTVTFDDESRGDLELTRDGMRVSMQHGNALAGDDAGEKLSAGDRVLLKGGQPGDVARAGMGDGQVLYGWMNSAGRNEGPAAAPRASASYRDGASRRGGGSNRADDRNRTREDDFDDDEGDDRDWRDSRHELPPEVDNYYDELSSYGRWRFVPGYGWAWRPHRVERNWVPFTVGFWRSTPWGMFWVSSEPWGWAPYRYGSWRFEPRWGWFWVPGPRFGGAWVVFYGEGDTWGWCPAFYDSGDWYPSYTTYIQINVINIYNYHPPIQIITRPPVRRPILGRPPMPAPPAGDGYSRHLPMLPRTDRNNGGGGMHMPPVRPASEVWRPRPVLGGDRKPRNDEPDGRPEPPPARPGSHGIPRPLPPQPDGAPTPRSPRGGDDRRRQPPVRPGDPHGGHEPAEDEPPTATEPRRHPAPRETPPEIVPPQAPERQVPEASPREPAPAPTLPSRRLPRPAH